MFKLILALTLMLIVPAVLVFSPLFLVKNIRINQKENCARSEAVQELFTGKNIIFVTSDTVSKTVREKYSCATSVSSKKELPGTLEINIGVSEVVVKVADTDFFLTQQGSVKRGDYDSKPTLHLLEANSLTENSQITNENILNGLKIAAGLTKVDFVADNLRQIDENSFAAYNQSDQAVIFSSKKDPNLQLDSLQFVLSKAKIDGTKIAKIDLRFDKPVIVQR